MEDELRDLSDLDVAQVAAWLACSEPWTRLGYSETDWTKLLSVTSQRHEAMVSSRAGRAIGIALVRPRFLVGSYLELLAVAPDARGDGVGSRLLLDVETRVFKTALNLFVCVSDFNTAAARFYARHGYAEVGRIPDLLIPGSAELLLRKTVGPARK